MHNLLNLVEEGLIHFWLMLLKYISEFQYSNNVLELIFLELHQDYGKGSILYVSLGLAFDLKTWLLMGRRYENNYILSHWYN